MTTKIAYVSNTNLLRLDGLQLEGVAGYVNDATVTVTIKDSSGTTVTGDSFPKTMSYVTSSDGRYEAALSHNLALENGKRYTAQVTATKSGSQGYWQFTFVAKTRT